jgi:hypothetical protein
MFGSITSAIYFDAMCETIVYLLVTYNYNIHVIIACIVFVIAMRQGSISYSFM